MTNKGMTRAKGICKTVGVVVKLEVDMANPSKNKVLIDLYDKDLMPVIDELYVGDGTDVKHLKFEGEETEKVFDTYVTDIEQHMMGLFSSMEKKEEDKSIIFQQ